MNDNFKFTIQPHSCTTFIPSSMSDNVERTGAFYTVWTDLNNVDFKIEKWTYSYGQPKQLTIADWTNKMNYAQTPLTLIYDLDYNFHYADWLELTVPIAYTDIIPATTTTLTDANNSILALPDVYYVDGSSGSET